MSYTYEYTYPKDKEAAGFSGPIPIKVGNDIFLPGIMETDDYRNLIRASIQRIIGTNKGERVMQPEFGINLRKMLFEPLDGMLLEEIKEEIIYAVNKQEPRIEVNYVEIDPDIDNHTIKVAISFRYKRYDLEDTLNFQITG
jgi:hypothetical protein